MTTVYLVPSDGNDVRPIIDMQQLKSCWRTWQPIAVVVASHRLAHRGGHARNHGTFHDTCVTIQHTIGAESFTKMALAWHKWTKREESTKAQNVSRSFVHTANFLYDEMTSVLTVPDQFFYHRNNTLSTNFLIVTPLLGSISLVLSTYLILYKQGKHAQFTKVWKFQYGTFNNVLQRHYFVCCKYLHHSFFILHCKIPFWRQRYRRHGKPCFASLYRAQYIQIYCI